VTMYLLREDYI